MNTKINMPRGGFYVTLRCNLKCKLCAAHAPYYSNPWHPTIEDLLKQIDRFFELVDYIGHFSITGGEPLLRTDLHILVDRISNYSSQIGVLELFSNGTLIPSDSLLLSFAKYPGKIKFVVNAQNAIDKISKFLPNASYELRDYHSSQMHCDGWVDWKVGRTKNKTQQDAINTFQKCSLPQKLEFVSCVNNGVIYPCPQTRRCIELGLIPFDPKECVDLFDTSYTDAQIKQRIMERYQLTCLQACQFCDGQCDDSERFKPAEQLS